MTIADAVVPDVKEDGATHGTTKDEFVNLDRVQAILEELLSKQNLIGDVVLQRSMNAHMYMPLAAVAGHCRLADFGVDVGILLAAARRSKQLSVDEEKLLVRPFLKPNRNTLILHDLSDDVSEDELHGLFSTPSIGSSASALPRPPSPSACRLDVNHTAFLVFDSDESAQQAALWLRGQTLRGVAIKCAVKSENLIRSFFPAYGMQDALVTWAGNIWGGNEQRWHQQQWQQAWSESDAFSTAGGEYIANYGTSGHIVDHPDDGRGGLVGGIKDGTCEDERQWNYTHQFRRYTRQQIIERCNRMDELLKPESYYQFEKDHAEIGAALFRESAFKDWAPPPTPQIPLLLSGVENGDFDGGVHSRHNSFSGPTGAGGGAKPRARSRTTSGISSGHSQTESAAGWKGNGEGDWSSDWSSAGAARWVPQREWSGWGNRSGSEQHQSDREQRKEGDDRGASARQSSKLRWVEKGSTTSAMDTSVSNSEDVGLQTKALAMAAASRAGAASTQREVADVVAIVPGGTPTASTEPVSAALPPVAPERLTPLPVVPSSTAGNATVEVPSPPVATQAATSEKPQTRTWADVAKACPAKSCTFARQSAANKARKDVSSCNRLERDSSQAKIEGLEPPVGSKTEEVAKEPCPPEANTEGLGPQRRSKKEEVPKEVSSPKATPNVDGLGESAVAPAFVEKERKRTWADIAKAMK